MQYYTIVDVKIGSDLMLARTRSGRIGGYGVGHKSQTVFRNVAHITGENVGNFTEFIGDNKLMLPPIVYRD